LIKVIVRVLLGLIFFFMLGKLVIGHNGLLRQIEVQRQNSMLKAHNDSLLKLLENMEQQKKRLLSDSSYMEVIARTRFGMSKPEEQVYRFLEPQDSLVRKASTQPATSPGEANQGVTVTRPD